ncbi:MAG: Type module protein Cmr6 [Pseudomonadota bacterium]|nr:Type module protein Cmr6 [Pseudomonadota bacterium]
MPLAAVPSYLGQNFQDAPPGHRFGLYFKVWEDNWDRVRNISPALLKEVAALPPYAVEMATQLRQRQWMIATVLDEVIFSLPATSISPFMTGTGMEHPLENGFAFLSPYGLPYLPGSGVKGVLRRAAEELAGGICEDDAGEWNLEAIDHFFGREPLAGDADALRNRGALRFWDVFPEPAGNRLCIEIMTPHYGDYYQGKTTPHDSGMPNPILFLAVPPGSRFKFFVQCETALLPGPLQKTWKTLLETAFRHAFDWLGFGAKTAVGYGQFPITAIEEARVERQEEAKRRLAAVAAAQAEAELQKQREAMSPLDRAIEDVLTTAPQDQPRHKALLNALKQGRWAGDEARQVAECIRAWMNEAGAWRTQSAKKKPEKDEPYQTTLTVLAYLEGKKS